MFKKMQRTDLPALHVARVGILAMCLIVGFIGACNKPPSETTPAIKSAPAIKLAEVDKVTFEPKQTEGFVPIDMMITMTKEVKALKMNQRTAKGAGKNWSVKFTPSGSLSSLSSNGIPSGDITRPLTIKWINKDGTIGDTTIYLDVKEKFVNGKIIRKFD